MSAIHNNMKIIIGLSVGYMPEWLYLADTNKSVPNIHLYTNPNFL